jgi:carbamoyl-phosphate synthase small subunit
MMIMNNKALLTLMDGSNYQGYNFGAEIETSGEVIFCTSMTGYQEMLTDPYYTGQILVPTYPLIESARIQVRGLVVREQCLKPSHFLSQKTIDQYLAQSGIPGIFGVDTRAITRRLRLSGVMMGIITSNKTPQQALEELHKLPGYDSIDFVKEVTTPVPYQWKPEGVTAA